MSDEEKFERLVISKVAPELLDPEANLTTEETAQLKKLVELTKQLPWNLLAKEPK